MYFSLKKINQRNEYIILQIIICRLKRGIYNKWTKIFKSIKMMSFYYLKFQKEIPKKMLFSTQNEEI